MSSNSFIITPPQSARIAVAVVCHSLAILTTLFRLLHGWIGRRLWWDDFWAAVAFVMSTTIFILYLVGLRVDTNNMLPVRWTLLLGYTSTLWASRLSVAVAIARLAPPCGIFYRLTRVVPVVFGVIWMYIIMQNIVGCIQTGVSGFPWCTTISKYALYTGVQELVTNSLGDMWLIVAPVYMLQKMKLRRQDRTLILAVFSCGIFTAFASISHAIFTVLNYRVWMILIGNLELALSIVVSNLMAVVTYVYRAFRNASKSQNTDENHGAPPRRIHDPSSTTHQETTSGNIPRYETGYTSPAPSHLRQTALELTVLSHLRTTLDISSRNSTIPSSHDSNILNSVPFSSFSYPSTCGVDL